MRFPLSHLPSKLTEIFPLTILANHVRTITILTALVVMLVTSVMLSAAEVKERFTVTTVSNTDLDAAFERKEKTKDKGWKIFIKFTNKTDKPIRSITTDYQLREGDWIILDNNTGMASSSFLLKPRQSAVFGWISGVPSSVDSIHFSKVDVE